MSAHPEKLQIPAVKLLSPENQILKEGELPVQASDLLKLGVCGRLDQDSRGLLIFTQDGVFAKELVGEEKTIPKEYMVKVVPTKDTWQGISHEQIAREIGLGMIIRGGIRLQPAKAVWKDIDILYITLLEGKKRFAHTFRWRCSFAPRK